MSRKESAVRFLKMAGSGRTEDAYARFIAPDFIHPGFLRGSQ